MDLSSMMDEEVLSYKDTVLTRSDVDILRGSCYINDTIIGFYFRYLLSLYDSFDEILLVHPLTSFQLTDTENPDDAKEIIEPMKLSDKKIVIFTVFNSGFSEMGDTATHWSLLVYYRDMNSFIHHDSIRGVNNEYAIRLYEAVKGFVLVPSSSKASSTGKHNRKKKRGPQPLIENKSGPALPDFNEYEMTPQQSNGYDCGLYVMAIARTICQWNAAKSSRRKDVNWFSVMEKNVNMSSVEMAMRSQVLKLIEDLRV